MRKRRFISREPKKRQQITPAVAATLRGFIANTWLVIGSLRKKQTYDTKEKPWNPCLRAQQNYVAWCRKHEVNPECRDNFIYYFGIDRLFWEPHSDGLGGPSIPDKSITIATMELEIATGSANLFPFFGVDPAPKQESLPSYEDIWQVVLTVCAPGEDDKGEFQPKKKLTIQAKSYSTDSKPNGVRWSVNYQNRPIWGAHHRSRTEIEYMDPVRATNATYHQWWEPVLASLNPEGRFHRNLQVQVQPLTHRGRHEIRNSLYDAYDD